jgi:hypothetical protein
MRKKAGVRRQRPQLYKRTVTDPEALELAAQIMPVGDNEQPLAAYEWVDGRNRSRRMSITYPNGWTATISIGVDGKVTARRATMKIVTMKPSSACESTVAHAASDSGA